MTQDTIKTAQLYFTLSNQGDLPAIKGLLHSQATYSSLHTGLYYGEDDIMQMMTTFFAQFHSLNWQIDSIKATTQQIVEIEFTCCSIDHHQVTVERKGIERLVVVDGLIKHIEVR